MDEIKIGDRFEDTEAFKRHRGKKRILEVVNPDAGAGRALLKVWIGGKDVEKEVFVKRSRLLCQSEHKCRTYLRLEPAPVKAPSAAEASPRPHSLDSKSVGPLGRHEQHALKQHMKKWPATHFHKRLMLTLEQTQTALEMVLEERELLRTALQGVKARAEHALSPAALSGRPSDVRDPKALLGGELRPTGTLG